ncbi:MAG TPA: MFS transporter, partial [Chlamydiales bacterium]|nr:MFS transporter [Chlamydiales bacterium]
LSIIGSGLAFFSDLYGILCLGRFIQALGASVGIKITLTMVADLHVGHSATKVLSLLLLGIAVAPSVGAAIGGFLTTALGWKGCFAFLTLYTILLSLLCLTLPETAHKLDSEALQVRRIFRGYLAQFRNPRISLNGLLMGLSIAIFYVFSNEAPHIAIGSMGLTPVQYGLFNLLLPVGMCVGLLSGNSLAGKLRPLLAILLGILLALAGAVAMALSIETNGGWGLFLPQALIQMGTYFLWLFASSAGLSEASDKSNASAVMQFLNFGCAAAATFAIGVFAPQGILTLPLAIGALILLLLAVWATLARQKNQSQ